MSDHAGCVSPSCRWWSAWGDHGLNLKFYWILIGQKRKPAWSGGVQGHFAETLDWVVWRRATPKHHHTGARKQGGRVVQSNSCGGQTRDHHGNEIGHLEYYLRYGRERKYCSEKLQIPLTNGPWTCMAALWLCPDQRLYCTKYKVFYWWKNLWKQIHKKRVLHFIVLEGGREGGWQEGIILNTGTSQKFEEHNIPYFCHSFQKVKPICCEDLTHRGKYFIL